MERLATDGANDFYVFRSHGAEIVGLGFQGLGLPKIWAISWPCRTTPLSGSFSDTPIRDLIATLGICFGVYDAMTTLHVECCNVCVCIEYMNIYIYGSHIYICIYIYTCISVCVCV